MSCWPQAGAPSRCPSQNVGTVGATGNGDVSEILRGQCLNQCALKGSSRQSPMHDGDSAEAGRLLAGSLSLLACTCFVAPHGRIEAPNSRVARVSTHWSVVACGPLMPCWWTRANSGVDRTVYTQLRGAPAEDRGILLDPSGFCTRKRGHPEGCHG